MNKQDRPINQNSNTISRLFFLLLFFSLCNISSYSVAGSVPSADFKKYFNKDNIIFQKKGLSIYRSGYMPKKAFCNADPKKMYHQLDVFYDSPHLQRLKLLGSSYTTFVKDTVIPAIVKTCGVQVTAKNMNIAMVMHKALQIASQDAMFFISRENGITYTKYEPHDAKNNLTQAQITALIPASYKKLQEKRYADTKAAMKRGDDKRKYGWRCPYGCITLCNDTSKTYTIATSHLRWRDKGDGHQVEIEGWFKLKPNQCYPPQAKLYWWTYYSIAEISKKGKWTFPQWPVNEALMSGQKKSGLSGERGRWICVNKTDKFLRHVKGNFDRVFNKACPAGYAKAPVNLFTQGREGTDAVYLLGGESTSSENRVRKILLPQNP